MPIEHTPSRNEDEYFARENADLVREHRARLDAERQRAGAESPHMRCPRCGAAMQERAHHQVKIDVCTGCGGVWLDKGELELLERAESSSRRRFLGDLFGIKD